MVSTLVQSFGGNVGIGTKTTTFSLDVHGGTSSIEDLTTTGITVAGVTNAHVPSGMIAMWSGLTTSIPTGWSLCDGGGSPARPDLRQRFILGYGTTFSTIGATGGNFQKSITAAILANHKHNVQGGVSTAGSHTHTSTSGGSHGHLTSNQGGGHDHLWSNNTEDHNHPAMNASGSHGHQIPTGGGSHAHNNYIVDTRYVAPINGADYLQGGGASWWAVNNVLSYATANRPTTPHIHSHNMSANHNHNVNEYSHQHNTSTEAHSHISTPAGAHSHNTDNIGSHTHAVNTSATGSPTAVSIDLKPVYYVLAYIIKN